VRALLHPRYVGLSRAFERQIYRCRILLTSARQTAEPDGCASLAGLVLSQLSSICLGDEIVRCDWLTYYIQAVHFVKVFVRPILRLLCNLLSDSTLVFLLLLQGNQVENLFTVHDSERQLYAASLKSQGV
jgi:hypothetical protein